MSKDLPIGLHGVIWRGEASIFKDLLLGAKEANKHGLLVCGRCGWSWLTMADAKPDNYDYGTYVICSDEFECQRRRTMRMKRKGQND